MSSMRSVQHNLDNRGRARKIKNIWNRVMVNQYPWKPVCSHVKIPWPWQNRNREPKHNRSNYLCLNLPFDDVTHKGGGPFRANPVGEEAADKKEQRHPESHDHPVYSTVLHVGQAHGRKVLHDWIRRKSWKSPGGRQSISAFLFSPLYIYSCWSERV